MKLRVLFFALCVVPFVADATQNPDDADKAIRALDWHVGPRTENVAAKATLKTDPTLAFLDEQNSKQFLQLTGNIPEAGNFILYSKQDGWWATFSFSPLGYVKDDEKIDPDALLQQLKNSDGPANEERKRLGIMPLHTEGWYVPPHYDPASKRLEWGLKLRSEGHVVLNYTIRLLGRTGVMNATLVSSPETLDADVRSFKAALPGFEFNSGERYAEFRQGDRVAEYGLAALISGGAAAIAAKKGVWAALVGFLAAAWKAVAVAVAGLLTAIRTFFKRKS